MSVDYSEIERYDRDLFRAHDGQFVEYGDFKYFVTELETELAQERARAEGLVRAARKNILRMNHALATDMRWAIDEYERSEVDVTLREHIQRRRESGI